MALKRSLQFSGPFSRIEFGNGNTRAKLEARGASPEATEINGARSRAQRDRRICRMDVSVSYQRRQSTEGR